MTGLHSHCLICENIISIPDTEKINWEMPQYQLEGGLIGLLGYIDDTIQYPSIRKSTHEIENNRRKIGNVITIITHDSGEGEEGYSRENVYKVLNGFGKIGWEVVSTNTDYYYNDEKHYDLEKRYFMTEILRYTNTSDNEDIIGKISLTRTKYLMKKTKDISELTAIEIQKIRNAENKKRSSWF
jgi:hypothetical protein